LGLQGYIINKNKITTKLHNIFDSKTMIEYMTNTTEYLGIDYIDKIGAIFPYAIDHILPRLLTPLVVFPPLIIERNEDSLLGHKNKEKYWDKFFENHQDILEKYKDGTTLWGHTQNWELDGSWHPNHFNHVYDIVQEYEPTSVAFLKGLKNETP
jgi:hypothetical protein